MKVRNVSAHRGRRLLGHGGLLGLAAGGEGGDGITAAAAGGGEAGDAGAKAGEVVRPQVAAAEGIERMQIPVHPDDEEPPSSRRVT